MPDLATLSQQDEEALAYEQSLARLKSLRTPPEETKSQAGDGILPVPDKPPTKSRAVIFDIPDKPPEKPVGRGASGQRQRRERKEFVQRQMGPDGKIMPAESGFGKQWTMARLDNDKELMNYISDPANKVLPAGSTPQILKTKSGKSIPGYRLPDDPNFYSLNLPGLSPGDFGYASGALLTAENILPLAATFLSGGTLAGPAAAARTASVASKAGKVLNTGQSIAKAAAVEGGLSGAGRAIDEGVDTARGVQGGEGTGGKVIQSTLLGAIGGATGKGVEVGTNRAGGYRPPSTAQDAQAMRTLQESASAMNAGKVGLGDIDRQSVAAKHTAAANILDPKRRAAMTAREDATLKTLGEAFAKDARMNRVPIGPDGRINHQYLKAKVSDEQLDRAVRQYDRDIRRVLDKQLTNAGVGKTSKEQAGRDVLSSFWGPGGYNDLATNRVNRAYSEARQVADSDGAVYSLKNMAESAREELKKPIWKTVSGNGKTIDEPFKYVTDPEVIKIGGMLSRTQEIQNYAFKPIRGGRNVEITQTEASDVMSNLIKMRSRLGDIYEKQVKDGLVDINGKAASRLYGIISEALENSSSARANSAWRKANDLHREKLETLKRFSFGKLAEDPAIKKTGKPSDPLHTSTKGELAYQKVSPHLSDMTIGQMRKLQQIMGPDKFKGFRDAYIRDMAGDPVSAAQVFSGKLSDAEKYLMPDDIRSKIRIASNKIQRLDKTQIVERIKGLESGAERARTLLQNIGPAEIDMGVLRNLDIPIQAYRLQVIEDLINKTSDFRRGKYVISPEAFIRETEKLRASGAFDLLSKQQKELLKHARNFNSFLRSANDLGQSLHINSLMYDRMNILDPGKAFSARMESGLHSFFAWASEQPKVIDFVFKQGSPKYGQMIKTRAMLSAAIDVTEALRREGGVGESPGDQSPERYADDFLNYEDLH